jgi:hypothetical protein
MKSVSAAQLLIVDFTVDILVYYIYIYIGAPPNGKTKLFILDD